MQWKRSESLDYQEVTKRGLDVVSLALGGVLSYRSQAWGITPGWQHF